LSQSEIGLFKIEVVFELELDRSIVKGLMIFAEEIQQPG
jgi:hypothetical protein